MTTSVAEEYILFDTKYTIIITMAEMSKAEIRRFLKRVRSQENLLQLKKMGALMLFQFGLL